MSATRMPAELLLDSEASLRMADGLISDLRTIESRAAAPAPIDPVMDPSDRAMATLPEVLLRAYHEINAILTSLRQCRSVLERTTVTRLHRTQEKLREVSSATESAATSMLDGLDRALTLVDELEVTGDDADAVQKRQSHGRLRNELHEIMTCLQFQDITSQQLGYVTNVLEEVETRMAAVSELLDASPLEAIKLDNDQAPVEPKTFDPAASTLDADSRQAVADSIFFFGESESAPSGP
jgi:chemotaxis regulatin CheY-phosphate phosphatase CheZ